MPCSYVDIVMVYHDRKTLSYFLSPTTWEKILWWHVCCLGTWNSYISFVFRLSKQWSWENEIFHGNNRPRKGLEFLGLRIKCVESKLSVDVFAKPANIFT